MGFCSFFLSPLKWSNKYCGGSGKLEVSSLFSKTELIRLNNFLVFETIFSVDEETFEVNEGEVDIL